MIELDGLYKVFPSIGTFADELKFKKKYVNILTRDKGRFKAVLEIENSVEPGMPDLLVINQQDEAYLVEVKYARKGVITFKRSQIPWYKKYRDLNIYILAYNDKTKNVHYINVVAILALNSGTTFRLIEEVKPI